MSAELDGEKTIAVSMDPKDHDTYFEKIARGVYFAEFNERFAGEIKTVCTHCFDRQINMRDVTLLYYSMANEMRLVATAHPDIFRYKIGRISGPDNGFLLRMTFYDDITIFAIGT